MLSQSVSCVYHSVVKLRPLWWSSSYFRSHCLKCCLGSDVHMHSSEVWYLSWVPSPLWSQHFTVPWGPLSWSFCQKTEALVSLLSHVLPATMSQSGAKWWEQREREKSNGNSPDTLGITVTLIKEDFPYLHRFIWLPRPHCYCVSVGLSTGWMGKNEKKDKSSDFPAHCESSFLRLRPESEESS